MMTVNSNGFLQVWLKQYGRGMEKLIAPVEVITLRSRTSDVRNSIRLSLRVPHNTTHVNLGLASKGWILGRTVAFRPRRQVLFHLCGVTPCGEEIVVVPPISNNMHAEAIVLDVVEPGKSDTCS